MSGEFENLVASGQVPDVVRGFERAIARSFVSHPSASATQSEVKRRFDICARIFRSLRGDLKWSVPRIMDHMPRYLRCELDGTPWVPDDRPAWIPD